ncbi:hypothetical protein BKA67DRAFT_552099 [Truncatella angustata]|uniref:SWIM-type domain-containing protein n=1 Tax=Truncatella angustata TaxID=152316 RepID=A0A9P8ZZR6_9PEZI|nr:uncharacterized protein BKA67DRAFT_552099 [Truncatella angustata]KAH6656478.1 hypothetical protein BKA67DRAFT_552099 [Truncatella angustata]
MESFRDPGLVLVPPRGRVPIWRLVMLLIRGGPSANFPHCHPRDRYGLVSRCHRYYRWLVERFPDLGGPEAEGGGVSCGRRPRRRTPREASADPVSINSGSQSNGQATAEETLEPEPVTMMSTMSDTLPAPRALLTSLINSLASQPAPPVEQQHHHHHQSTTSTSRPINPQQPTNILSLLPPSSRTLLTTLHVIYPSLLLPALDLLDRGLVTRVLVLDSDSKTTATSSSSSLPSSSPPAPGEAGQPARPGDARASTFHLVRSARPQPARRGQRRAADAVTTSSTTTLAAGITYMVRTCAWSCDCAAFAFAAFPARDSPPTGGYHHHHISSSPRDDDDADDNLSSGFPSGLRTGSWEFGGLGLDGREGSGGGVVVGSGAPPCCKHLLACVLAERWGAVMGGYVQERRVGREEAAGLIGSL